MRGSMIVLGGLAMVGATFALTPQAVRSDVAERTNLPETVYLEAERQLGYFINWALSDGERPKRDGDTRENDDQGDGLQA